MQLSKVKLFEPKWLNVSMVLFPFEWIYEWMKHKFYGSESTKKATLVLDGLHFAEGPRIHQNHLYFSDMHANCVYKIDIETNQVVKRIEFHDKVSGLGFLPDNRMLVVAMSTRKLLCYDENTETTTEYADLTQVTQHRANDMVVDDKGNAYIGNFGFDVNHLMTSCTTTLVRVDVDQNVHVETTGLFFPNGCVITPDGKTLLVNETLSSSILAFDRDPMSGQVSNQRLWAYLGGVPLDGMCLDAEGCVWVAVPQVGIYRTSGCVVRVNPKGKILEKYGFDQMGLQSCAIACALATNSKGEHILYVLEAETIDERVIKAGNSRIKALGVNVGPAIRKDCPNYMGGYC